MLLEHRACVPLDAPVTMMFFVAMVVMVWKEKKKKGGKHKWGRYAER